MSKNKNVETNWDDINLDVDNWDDIELDEQDDETNEYYEMPYAKKSSKPKNQPKEKLENHILDPAGKWVKTNKSRTSEVDRWLTENGLFMIKCWARDMTKQDVAEMMGINPNTLSIWSRKYKQIAEALSKSAQMLDYEIENAVMEKALGQKTCEVKTTFIVDPMTGELTANKVERFEKQLAPDMTAATFWLTNRNPEKWKRNRDNIFGLDDEESNIVVNIVKPEMSQDEWLADDIDGADELDVPDVETKEKKTKFKPKNKKSKAIGDLEEW